MIGMSVAARAIGIGLLLATGLFGAELAGIWMGEVAGKNGEKQDVAFQFQVKGGGVVTGVMFGDEFDLPVEELRVEGDRVSFTVTSTDYYSGRKTKSLFTGMVTGAGLELVREQGNAEAGKVVKTTIRLRRLG